MKIEISNLVDRLNDSVLSEAAVIPWGCPVPSFGNLSCSTIATIGLNPSNREFVDIEGKELDGSSRRFHTLNSLGIDKWPDAKSVHLKAIQESCEEYFCRNPYNDWFKKLDYIISGTNTSYYFPSSKACHLDLIPYATSCKWTDLTSYQRSLLLEITGDTLGLLLQHSPVELIILNGQAVVDNFQKVSGITFEKVEMPEWKLPRKSTDGVMGYAYKGMITNLGGIDLKRNIMVLGYNHNIQSSFGVTKTVLTSIRNWISTTSKQLIRCGLEIEY